MASEFCLVCPDSGPACLFCFLDSSFLACDFLPLASQAFLSFLCLVPTARHGEILRNAARSVGCTVGLLAPHKGADVNVHAPAIQAAAQHLQQAAALNAPALATVSDNIRLACVQLNAGAVSGSTQLRLAAEQLRLAVENANMLAPAIAGEGRALLDQLGD